MQKKFVASLVKELADESNSEAARMMAAVICKNLIGNRTNDARYADLWIQLEPFFKQNMKEAILSTLVCPSSLVRTQCANLIASIAAIEIPRGEWTEVITNLCTNASSEVPNVKLASLQTLGFICEELEPKDLTNELKNAVIVALTTNIDKDENQKAQGYPATKLAVQALLHSLPYAAQNFKVENERAFIMAKIFSAMEVSDVDIRENALQVLVELAR